MRNRLFLLGFVIFLGNPAIAADVDRVSAELHAIADLLAAWMPIEPVLAAAG